MADFIKFIEAIQSEDLERVKILFRKEFINQRSSGGWTALHWASMCNNKGDIVKYLVREGCNMEDEARGVYGGGWRCIHMAAWRGKVEVLKTLIEGGCDLDSLTEGGETASSIALGEGNKECVEIIKKAEKEREAKYKSLLKENSLSKIMNPQTGKSLLDDLLDTKNTKILEAIKSKPVDYQEIDEWKNLDLKTIDPKSYKLLHECMLARCLYQRYEDGVYVLCTTELANKKSLFMSYLLIKQSIYRHEYSDGTHSSGDCGQVCSDNIFC